MEVEALAQSLVDPGVLDAEGAEAALLGQALGQVVNTLIKVAPGPCLGAEVKGRLVRAAVQMLGVPDSAPGAGQIKEAALGALGALAELSGLGEGKDKDKEGVQELLAVHFAELVREVGGERAGPITTWRKDSPKRLALDALVREGPVAAGRNLGLLVPIFVASLQPERDAEFRLSMMLLLETVVANPLATAGGAIPEHSKALISDALLPNCVWRAGRVASTIRKVALICLYTLLRDKRIPPSTLYEVVPPLLPVLKTDLEDYDASSRQLVALSMERIFTMLPRAFDEEPIRQLYPELLKRLDDSSDDVRRAVCGALRAFLGAAAPEVFAAGILDYMLDQLLVHLDDQDPSIQEAVHEVLKAAVAVDPVMVGKKAEAARATHRSPGMCDELSRLAARAGAAGKG